MTLVRLTTQARRVEGGHLIGRASRFSTGRAVTALKTNRYRPDPVVGELDASARNTTAWDICSSPISFPMFSVSRGSQFCLGRQLHR